MKEHTADVARAADTGVADGNSLDIIGASGHDTLRFDDSANFFTFGAQYTVTDHNTTRIGSE